MSISRFEKRGSDVNAAAAVWLRGPWLYWYGSTMSSFLAHFVRSTLVVPEKRRDCRSTRKYRQHHMNSNSGQSCDLSAAPANRYSSPVVHNRKSRLDVVAVFSQ